MRRDQIRKLDDAFDYLTDCMLATVDGLALKKSRSQGDFVRHIAIAQAAVEFADRFKVPLSGRGQEVMEVYGRSVNAYADSMDVRKEKP